MPGRPRKDVIDEENVGIYHCWSRCIRRAFLCGVDPVTERDYSYRKEWISERLKELAHIFAVDACVWAVLSNHYHLIVRNRPDLVLNWSDEEVARRWWQLFPERCDENGNAAEPNVFEINSILADPGRVEELRRRLSSISWFMKSVNEVISKRANKEDGESGHFWKDRFGCRSLLSEGAVLACSIYVDLNEIRAGLAKTPENSKNTSAYLRILEQLKRREQGAERLSAGTGQQDDQTAASDFWLCPINENDRVPLLEPGAAPPSPLPPMDLNPSAVNKKWRHGFLPITVEQYIEILDWTGRQLVVGKVGSIDENLPPILERLGIRPDSWLDLIDFFEQGFHSAVGDAASLQAEAARTGKSHIQGIGHARKTFL